MPVQLSLEGRVALITGGSRGIGAATVKLFCAAGAQVVFNYEKAKAAADEVMKACGGQKPCHAIQQELDSPESGSKLVATAVRHFGRLDILVANHGIWPPEDHPIDEMPDEQWLRTQAVNVNSIFGLVKHAAAQMKAQSKKSKSAKPAGHIVLISSTSGQRGEAFHVDYSASKGALISLTKGLATELAPHKIYVNCVAPGWVATDMAAPALNHPATLKQVLAPIPMKRVGTPEEIAGPILFLCTEHAGFITGEICNVNGGAVLVG
jgi:3-oxoacyl-[acyl-carrier protein] reductase